MIERELVLPVSPEQLWEALTDPAALEEWFGARVDWDLRTGGHIRTHGDGDDRHGCVGTVDPGRRLQFEWWPERAPHDASEVTYELESVEQGTRLTVTERALPESIPSALASTEPALGGRRPRWVAWDTRLANLWIRGASQRAGAVGHG